MLNIFEARAENLAAFRCAIAALFTLIFPSPLTNHRKRKWRQAKGIDSSENEDEGEASGSESRFPEGGDEARSDGIPAQLCSGAQEAGGMGESETGEQERGETEEECEDVDGDGDADEGGVGEISDEVDEGEDAGDGDGDEHKEELIDSCLNHSGQEESAECLAPDLKQVLQDSFGLSEFREGAPQLNSEILATNSSGQEEVISSLVRRKPTLAILPTGKKFPKSSLLLVNVPFFSIVSTWATNRLKLVRVAVQLGFLSCLRNLGT